MRATVIAVGTRGDVQPIVALAAGLRRSGHEVRFATESIYAGMVRAADLEYYALSGNSEKFFSGKAGIAFRDSLDRSPEHFRTFWSSYVAPGFRRHLLEVVEPCNGADFLICLPYLNIGPSLAQKFKVPCFVAGMIPEPAFPTRDFAYPFDNSAGANLTPDENLETWKHSEPLVRMGYEPVQQWRGKTLGLPVETFEESQMHTRTVPHLYGFSRLLIPRPAEWPPHIAITGAWFPDQGADYRPPADLQSFLDQGEKPVLIGFGSHVGSDPQRLTRIVVDALQMAGRRGILISGWGGLHTANLPDTIFGTTGVPYQWLLPKVAAVVHHGGSGTVGICLHTGVPQVITAFGYDQTFWGRRIAGIGAGPQPLRAKTMMPEELAAAIHGATEPHVVRRAAEAGEIVAAERGVESAVAVIEQTMREAHAQTSAAG